MSQKRNYLLGYGERLASPVEITRPGRDKDPPYTFEEAQERIVPMLEAVSNDLEALPEKACPGGEAVVSVILHPEYYAKSYFPGNLLRDAGLRAVGSRARRVLPDKRSRDRTPEEAVTTELFVAGARSSFLSFAEQVQSWTPESTGAKSLPAIERVSSIRPEERIRPRAEEAGRLPLEVVLHASEDVRDRFILAGFKAFLEDLSLEPDFDRLFFAGQLCFLRLRADEREAHQVAQFSFLRVLREMPRLRTTQPLLHSALVPTRTFELPQQEALDPHLRVAVLDGGLSETSLLTAWANVLEGPGVGEADPEFLWHGETVTSAILFGSISGDQLERPLCRVDHYRVLDKRSGEDPFELFEVLERVKSILDQGNYEFVNLSMGPVLPVDDDEVHAWTAVLDEYLSDGKSLVSIAAGNTGLEPADPVLHKWRVQVPSDCVNGLTVGASSSLSPKWARAPYSSRGPGRSPGIVKPDLVAFGGSRDEPFWVADPNVHNQIVGTGGTSYAAPSAMRSGLAVRAHFGAVLSPLAIKALLIHSTDPGGHPQSDVGWGRLPNDLDDLVVCPDHAVRVVYQDEITAARYRRIHIPLPREGLTGKVYITATFCFATPVDPEHPGNYTKSGLSIVFRPDKSKFDRLDAVHADTAAFFQPKKLYSTEQRLRGDAHKWETCLHRRIGKLAKGLNEPVFDIHYNARSEGRGDASAGKIRYALILTVEAPRVRDLYDRVVRAYRARLQPLTPIIEVPIRSSTV